MTVDRSAPACLPDPDGIPTCSTGPLGRLTWTLRELAGMLHLTRKP